MTKKELNVDELKERVAYAGKPRGRPRKTEEEKIEYKRRYYQENKEEMIKSALARYAKKKLEKLGLEVC